MWGAEEREMGVGCSAPTLEKTTELEKASWRRPPGWRRREVDGCGGRMRAAAEQRSHACGSGERKMSPSFF
jgi:hypothetical protein